MDVAIESCVRAGLDPVVVVLGAVWLTPVLMSESADGDMVEVRLVENPDWATGMASSLWAGLAALGDELNIDAVVVKLVDIPSVGREHLRRISAGLRDGVTATVATYEGIARTSAGLTREVWAEVGRSVVGDEGARKWLRTHRHLVTEVECADLGSWTDIEHPVTYWTDSPGRARPLNRPWCATFRSAPGHRVLPTE